MPIVTKTAPLGLADPEHDGDDDDHKTSSPLRFLELPFCGTLLAFGGEDGQIVASKRVGSAAKASFQVIHQFDDLVRAVAVSRDAKRIAVGFDDGSTRIYTFDDYQPKEDGGDGEEAIHPFAGALVSSASKKSGDKDPLDSEEDDDLLLSQDFRVSASLESFAGPRSDLPVRSLRFLEPDSYKLAVATEAGLVVVDVDSPETLSKRELEHEAEEHHSAAGVRGLAVHEKFLASLDLDGRLCVWDASRSALVEREASPCVTKKDVGEIHGADAFDRSCMPVFGRFGERVVLATPGLLLPKLRFLDASGASPKLVPIELRTAQPDQGHLEPVVCCAFLPPIGGTKCFLTAARDSRLVVWRWDEPKDGEGDHTATPLETLELPLPATDLLLLPSHRVLVACADATHALIDLAPHLPQDASNANNANAQPKTITKKTAAAAKKSASWMDDDDDSDVDFGGPEDQDGSKDDGNNAASPKTNRVRFVDDEADEDDDADEAAGTENNNENENSTEDIGGSDKSKADAGSDDPDNTGAPDGPLEDDAMEGLDADEEEGYLPMRTMAAPEVPPQPAFSPASTPLDLTRRFMCWNHLGALTLLQGDDRNTVDISFTDSAFQRPISFTDNMNFILGSLGEDGGIFATDLQNDDDEDEDSEAIRGLDDLHMSETTKRAVRKSQKKAGSKPTGSALFFYRFETFGNPREKDWYLTLPDGERVLGAATGSGWAAAATSRRFLRFYTTGGNQAQMVWLKGDPVTMAGRGRFLAVFYHEGPPLSNGTQRLGYTLWDAAEFRVVAEGSVCCLSKKATLTWVGFSNDFSLMAMDSEGMVSMLVQAGSNRWQWIPALDTIGLRKSKDDQFWPITVYDGKMICVPLKGGNTYPDAARRPVTSTLGLRMPLALASVAKTTILEEVNVRSNIALGQKRFVNELEDAADSEESEREFLAMSAQVDKVTLKLFAAMVDANKLERALDLVDRLHLEKSYDLAIQLADRQHKLADLIEEARDRRFGAEEDEPEYDDESGEEGDPHSPETTHIDRLSTSRQISPESAHINTKRGLKFQGKSSLMSRQKKQRLE